MASLSVPTTCAACGKEGGDELKACTACKLVKYCNRDCQISHRSKHKKECKKCVAELHDEALFKEPPPPEECPICFLTLPIMYKSSLFKSCCGKVICCGCIYAMKKNEGVELCPFCRTPSVSREKDRGPIHLEFSKIPYGIPWNWPFHSMTLIPWIPSGI